MESKLDQVIKYVKSKLADETTGHDFHHALRVMNNAIAVSKNSDILIEVVQVSALTHDLIDKKVTNNIEQEIINLKRKLEEIGYSIEAISSVIEIISNVSFSKGNIPLSLEGKIVQDADRLDALGAIGIARTFAYGGKNNRKIYDPENKDGQDSLSHFYDKLLKLVSLMNTDEAKKIAKKRTDYMVEFLREFYLEWDGLDLN